MAKDRSIIFFDLDGTLIDHFDAIYQSYVHAAETMGFAVKDYPTVHKTVGGGLEETLATLLENKEVVPEALALFRNYFKSIMYETLYLLPGSLWILEELRKAGYKPSVLTNKSTWAAKPLCDYAGITARTDHIIGTCLDDNLRKPHPGFTNRALEQVNSTATQAALFGDSTFDIDTAANIGMPSYIVLSGSHDRAHIASHSTQPVGVFDDMYEAGEKVFGFKLPESRERQRVHVASKQAINA